MSALPVTGETASTQPENRLFYPALDGIRAVAFLMVFFWHYLQLPWGWSGVDVFFVLSGFLITGILFDSLDEPHRARTFYIRRTLRIFPLYYGVLLLLLLSAPLLHWQWSWKWITWPLYLGNLAVLKPLAQGSDAQQMAYFWLTGRFHGHLIPLNFGHFWSLCVEEQFYLVWPWIVFKVRDRRRLLWICAVSLPLCLAARLLGYYWLPKILVLQNVIPHFTLFRLDDLLAGGLLALLLRGPQKHMVLRLARWLFPVLAACVALLAAFSADILHGTTSALFVYTTGFTGLCVVYTVLIAHLVQPGLLLSRLFATRPLRWAGRISYGAYVFHDIFHHYVTRAASHLPFASAWSYSIVGLATTYSLAWLSFRFCETPFLNLKNRWAPAMPRAKRTAET